MVTLINTVVIKTPDHKPVVKSLMDWIELYSDQLGHDLEFRLYRSDETVVIEPGKYLDNEHFSFLVNYLVYPDIDYIKEVTGYTLIDDSEELSPGKPGEQIIMFVPPFDDEHDVVYWLTASGKVYKTDMGFKTVETTLTKRFDIPKIDFSQLSMPEIIRQGGQQIMIGLWR
jgi:hypothetical protein